MHICMNFIKVFKTYPLCFHLSALPRPHCPSSPPTHPLFSFSLPCCCFFLIRPLILVELGVVVRLAVLHGDTARQDGGHIVADGLPLRLLLPLLLHLPQLDTWKWMYGEGGSRNPDVPGNSLAVRCYLCSMCGL